MSFWVINLKFWEDMEMGNQQALKKAANQNKVSPKISARYWLLDQRVSNTVQIYDTHTRQYLILPALEIARDRAMIGCFHPEEAFMIGVIAGHASC